LPDNSRTARARIQCARVNAEMVESGLCNATAEEPGRA
jgi:hypothetical protein